MSADFAAEAARPGLIWGFDITDGVAQRIDAIGLLQTHASQPPLRWLHLNLSDQRTRRWIASAEMLAAPLRELLLSTDGHARVIAAGDDLGLILPDVERDFEKDHEDETRLGLTRIAVTPALIVTARHHPVHSGDIVRERLEAGLVPTSAVEALELMLVCMAEAVRRRVDEADDTVQTVEDALLHNGSSPNARTFLTLRSLMVRLHRLLTGARATLRRAEEERIATPAFELVINRAGHRLASLDAELLSVQSELRLLREEIDLQATQKTNQNLYVLSIVTALMAPATVVTGLFGMNTGGLPWAQHPYGTLIATGFAIGSAAAVYLILRLAGFFRR